jgi:hypothetical protein
MRVHLLGPLALVLFVAAACAPSPEPVAAVSPDELAARIRARLDAAARGDVAEWGTFVAEDCICGLETKAAIERAMAGRPPGVKNWYGEVLDLRLRPLAHAVVARYRVAESTEVGGQRTSLQVWRTETFEQQAGAWVLVAGADTVIPPEPTAVEIDPRILNDYLGLYEYTPGADDRIFFEGGHFFVQPSGEPRVELLAESASSFFAKGEPWRLTFVRDPQGRVTGLVFRDQGQEWAAKRVPDTP